MDKIAALKQLKMLKNYDQKRVEDFEYFRDWWQAVFHVMSDLFDEERKVIYSGHFYNICRNYSSLLAHTSPINRLQPEDVIYEEKMQHRRVCQQTVEDAMAYIDLMIEELEQSFV